LHLNANNTRTFILKTLRAIKTVLQQKFEDNEEKKLISNRTWDAINEVQRRIKVNQKVLINR
jgi:hypothetical protein